MDRNLTIRILGWIAVLLLFAPMYRQCNGMKNNEEKPAEEVAPVEEVAPTGEDSVVAQTIDSLPATEIDTLVPVAQPISLGRQVKEFMVMAILNPFDDSGDNVYMMSTMFISDAGDLIFDSRKEIDKFNEDSRSGKVIWICLHLRYLCFFIIGIQTWVFVIRRKKRPRFSERLVQSNFVLIFLAALITSFDPNFESWDQIRWGFYVFLTVQVALFFCCGFRRRRNLIQ